MKSISSILVPFDFSIESDNALKYAHFIAQSTNCIVDVFNAVSPPSEDVRGSLSKAEVEALIEEKKKANWKRLDDIISHRKFDDSRIRMNQLVLGYNETLSEGVMRAVSLNHSGLIITGTKGVDGLPAVTTNSNSSDFITKSTCPVLVVKHYDSALQLNKILFSSEFLEEDDEKSLFLFELAKIFNAEVTLAHIMGDEDDSDKFNANLVRFAEKYAVSHDNLICHYESPIVKGIFNVATELEVDLLVMGYHQSKVEEHELYGSLAEDFINHTQFPVLVLPM